MPCTRLVGVHLGTTISHISHYGQILKASMTDKPYRLFTKFSWNFCTRVLNEAVQLRIEKWGRNPGLGLIIKKILRRRKRKDIRSFSIFIYYAISHYCIYQLGLNIILEANSTCKVNVCKLDWQMQL